RQWTVPGHAGLGVGVDGDAAAGFAHLHYRTLVDEQAGQFDRFVQRTAAVVAQVHDHAVDILRLELGQQLGDVAGGRGVVVRVLPATLEVLVERRQLDHADAPFRFAVGGRQGDRLGLGRLFLQLDLLPGDGDQRVLAVD